jgi:bis(5'-nucleosyl)-tetraphosphatase (symmetrical)
LPTYAIGDVQGCHDELLALLGKINFREREDRLWFVGDLVNRGPKSLEVLRFVKGLGQRAVTVLGNHDLHLVAQYEGAERARKDDTLDSVLEAKDARELVDWVRTRPMMHVEDDVALVHAGLLPVWSVTKAVALGKEVERALQAKNYKEFLKHMYGSQPATWDDALEGWDRLRVIVNAMTRMRFCTAGGKMELKEKGAQAPKEFRPWYEFRKEAIVAGHWSQLGLKIAGPVALIDSGCIWGGSLTAMRIEDRAIFQVPCAGYQKPGGD